MAIAGGAPGAQRHVEGRRHWAVIVLASFDPPIAERLGVALADALTR